MRSYLSKIVSRAAGITEEAAIKPSIQSWPVKKNTVNRFDPFEEGGYFTEVATPTSSIESTISPLEKTMPFKKEQYSKNDFPSINQNDHERKKSEIHGSDRIFPVRHENLTSFSPETNISLTSSNIRSNTFKTEKPLEVKEQVIEKNEKFIEEIHISEPLEIEPNNKHEKTPALKETTLKKKEKILEPYQLLDKLIQPTILIKKEVKPATVESKNNKKQHKKNDRRVSEMRPKAPLNKHPSFFFEKKQKDKRLVIGNLKVEVVTPASEKTSQAPVQKIQRIIKTQPRQENKPGYLKLRFGLGQV